MTVRDDPECIGIAHAAMARAFAQVLQDHPDSAAETMAFVRKAARKILADYADKPRDLFVNTIAPALAGDGDNIRLATEG